MGTGSAVAPAYSASKFAIRGLTQVAGISRLLSFPLRGLWIC